MNVAPGCKPIDDPGEVPDHYGEPDFGEDIDEWRARQIENALEPVEEKGSDNEDSLLTDEFVDKLGQLDDKIYDDKESVEEALTTENIDAFRGDSFTNSKFPIRAMAKGYILRMVSPDINSFDKLRRYLENNSNIAEAYGFDPNDIPDRTTFSTQWYDRYLPGYRKHIRFEAAQFAANMKRRGFELDDNADNLIDSFLPDDDGEPDIPEACRIENESRDRVFNEFKKLFNDVIDYDRATNWEVEPQELTDLATFTARRNEPPKGGRDVYVKENDDIDGEDYMSEETLPSPVRNKSRQEARQRQMESKPMSVS
jgi:hypothetical protein